MNIQGAKKGGGKGRKPNIAKDTTASTNYLQALYGLSEGEIFGLADGGKSIKLDGTPLINANGQPNFSNVTVEFRSGTVDQTHIAGFSAVENETSIGVELRHDRPFTKAISNTALSAVVIRLGWNGLREQNGENGDITGYKIEYAIDIQTDGGAWQTALSTLINDKASQGYQRSHRIDLPKARRGWTVRVRRITPNRDSDLVGDTMNVVALTEVIDAKLRYPCTALLAVKYDAETFGNIAKLSVRLKGKLIQVPSNYNPDTRTYTGLWDGTFKTAYSNNPAWVFYDLCTARRYGLGERLAGKVDKWCLYQLAQYCDEMVDDGNGGREPRFTCNVYLQRADDAYRVLQNLSSVFRAMSYWNGTQIVVDADIPKDPVYTFSNANVVGGAFSYTGTRARDRHTIAKVAYDDPDNDFKTDYVWVKDEKAMAKYGANILEINAFGCTSRGQAYRAGLWALTSEQLESETVTFSTGLDGFIPQVGQIINVADNARAGIGISGRIERITGGRNYTLDRTAGKVGDTFVLGDTTAQITKVAGNTITTSKPMGGQVGQVWAVASREVAPRQYRVLSIVQNDDATFGFVGLQYEPSKFVATDTGTKALPKPVSIIKPTILDAPANVSLTAHTRTHQGQAVTTLSINWSQVVGATAYIVEWRKDNSNWQVMPKVASQSVDIDGVYAGAYEARVRAVDAFDNESLHGVSVLTNIAGKQGKPPKPARITATGKLFGMDLAWVFAGGSDDTNFTEIQVSPDGRSNIATLGTFAYPTNKHEITGLQDNLTQYYRARIVDKLGNTSDWTAWTSGTTEARADKVLDLIGGQIRENHLDQTLRTPIGKIGTLESAVAGVNNQLPTLNSRIATESGRISGAIKSIGVLQTYNTQKTQQIADLTQTVGGHTSSIRELGVTTGDLSQKYTALKSASDTANAEITAIKQTQAGQAIEQNSLKARFDSLAVGGRNLLAGTNVMQLGRGSHASATFRRSHNAVLRSIAVSDSPISTNNAMQIQATATTGLGGGFTQDSLYLSADDYTVSAWVKGVAGDVVILQPFWANGQSGRNKRFVLESSEWVRITHTATAPTSQVYSVGYVYLVPQDTSNTLSVLGLKLERGNVATDWTPAIDDLQADIDSKATTANLETLRQTLTNADNALSQQIAALDANYKKSDSDLTARLAKEETARATGDNANAQAIRTLESTVNGIGGRVGTSESKIATLERTTSDLNGAIATAQNQLNARFDNLAVGGRNLLKYTQHLDQLWRFASGGQGNSMSIADGVARLTGVGSTWKHLGYDINKTTAEAWLKDGATFTLSVYAKKISGNPRLSIALRKGITGGFRDNLVGKSFDLSSDWQKLVVSGTITPDDLRYLFVRFEFWGDGVVELKKPKLEYGTIATDWTPAPEDLQVDLSPYATNAKLDEFKQAQATKDTATAGKLSQLESGLNGKASSVALEQLNTKVNQVDGKITAEANKVSQLQTTVGGQTTSIRNVEQSVNGVRAIKAVTVDNNGFISGYGLMSDLQNGRVTSRFGINADQIYFGATTSAKKPFVFTTRTTTIDGVSYPAGAWLNSASIAKASITMLHIADSIQSDNYVEGRQGWRLFKDGRFELNNTFGDGSSLELNSKGLIVWYNKAQGKKAVELGILT